MLESAGMRDLARRALRQSPAEGTEAIIRAQHGALTRYANNAIHQNVQETNIEITLRAVEGRRTGLAVTNDPSDEGLRRAAERAQAHADANAEDPEFPGLTPPDGGEPSSIETFDETTAFCEPDSRADGVGTVCQLAAERGLWAYGAFRTGAVETGYANSLGLERYHPQSYTDFQIVAAGEAGSGRAQATSWHLGGLEPETLGREAIAKAERVQNPRAIEPGVYPVVLDPYATDNMLSMLNMHGMGAQAVQEGRSWMNGRIGTRAMAPAVTIRDDGLAPDALPQPFDFEGVPRQPGPIVDEGIVQGPVHDRATAQREGRASTGHALPPQMRSMGPIAGHLAMDPGDADVDAMIGSLAEGLYITRFWYTRLVHPSDCVITGMTRDGVLKIEDGELAYPVKNLRFTQSFVEALAHVRSVGHDRRALMSRFGVQAHRVPALCLDAFRFNGLTA